MPSATATLPSNIDTVSGAVAFTDIVSFTEYTAVAGDEAANELLNAQEAIVAQALPADARVVKELGDGLMLWFADAQSAVDTCLELLRRFEQHTFETMQPLWVRIGVHWGTQTRRRDDLIGHDVNLAARIAGEAGPAELLLSEDTVLEIERAFADSSDDFEEIGPVVMKGIPDPVRLYRAVTGWDED